MSIENSIEEVHNRILAKQVMDTNSYTVKFGLSLSEEDTKILIAEKAYTLKTERRVEFGASILPQIIFAFCDSDYISQDNYLDTIVRLQEIFFLYKNEMQDEITDEELLNFMREQFEGSCHGDLEFLETTCLSMFAKAVRAGYCGYRVTQGRGEGAKADLARAWSKDLYLKALDDLFMR